MNGRGKYAWAEDNYYEGDFVNGQFCGNGLRRYGNGDTYEGQYESDKPFGRGKYTYASSSNVYEGIWDTVNSATDIIKYENGVETARGSIIDGNFVQEGDFVVRD